VAEALGDDLGMECLVFKARVAWVYNRAALREESPPARPSSDCRGRQMSTPTGPRLNCSIRYRGRMSWSKISSGTFSVTAALGMSTMPPMCISQGATLMIV
jgi:hypothetical protein